MDMLAAGQSTLVIFGQTLAGQRVRIIKRFALAPA
jgi:hypothetical protein